MLLDFEDHRPETPRVPTVISVREGVLLSLVVHMALVIAMLLAPDRFFQPSDAVVVPVRDQQPMRFVEVMPLKDMIAKPPRPADASDQDRRSTTREKAPKPDNPMPLSKGNTPELVEGGRTERASAPEPPGPPSPPAPDASSPLPDTTAKVATNQAPALPPRAASGSLGQALRNLQQFVHADSLQNPNGGGADQSADIQFDSMGVDFGPWLRRFKNQVERNWIVPSSAEYYKGRTVIQFYVLRSGAIIGLNVIQPAGYPALTSSALSALKLSNPTAKLPDEYPADRAFFTVTFHYNEFDRTSP